MRSRPIETANEGPPLDAVARAHVEFGYYRYTAPASFDEMPADVAATVPPVQALDAEAPDEFHELPSAHETSIDAVSDPATASGQVLPSEDYAAHEVVTVNEGFEQPAGEAFASETAPVGSTSGRGRR